MRYLTLILVCLIFHFEGLGNTQINDVREGYYITHNSDTVYGKFRIYIDAWGDINYARMQWKLHHIDSTGKIRSILPDEISAYWVSDSLHNLIFESLELYNNNFVFVRRLLDGHLKLFLHYKEVLEKEWYYSTLSSYFVGYPKEAVKDYFCLQKPDRELIKVDWTNFHKKLPRFLSDYPELALKIKQKEYRYTDIYRIVREYNTWYEFHRK